MALAALLTSFFWILAGNLAHADPARPKATVTVVAEAQAPFLQNMSFDEVRGVARDEARRNAIEQAVGVFVRSASVVHNSQITDELIASVARGVIEEEQWLEEGIEPVRDAKKAGSVVHVYHVRLKAVVRPVRVERRGGFEVHATLNKSVFQEGEEALIRIRSSEPAYLHLFSVAPDGSVTLLLPNRFVPRNQIPADQDIVFPGEPVRALGVRLRAMLPKGAKRAVEYIKVIATRKPIVLVGEQETDGVFRTFDGAESGMIQDVVKRLASLDDEDWVETTLPYEIRR